MSRTVTTLLDLCHNCFQSEPVQTESTNHSDTLKAKSCDNFLNKAVLFLLQVISQHLPLQKSNLKQQLSETPHIHLHLIETILLDYIDLLVNTSFNPDQILIGNVFTEKYISLYNSFSISFTMFMYRGTPLPFVSAKRVITSVNSTRAFNYFS
jgi:hypothetical protein